MTELSTLVELARPYVGDCPAVLIKREMLRFARKFCQKTHAWQESVYVGFGANQPDSSIGASKGNSVLSIIKVTKKDDTKELGVAPNPNLLPLTSGEPSVYSSSAPGKISIGPLPTATYIALVKVSVQPSLTGTTISEQIAESWGEEIAEGAVSSLMLMKDAKWYDPKQSSVHLNNFNGAVADARIRSATGYSNTSQRARGGRFI